MGNSGRTVVKVCGIREAAGALAAAEAGVDMLGFHFCPSPRRITPEQARTIAGRLPEDRPKLVGVFIDQPEDEVREVASAVGLDAVQLHGSEPGGFECGLPVMKVLKVRGGVIPDPGGWPDPLLLDSWSPDQRGGTGSTWDWESARQLLGARRVIVAGGLNPRNVAGVVSRYRPYGVDVSSGVEASVGVKDASLVRAFVQAVHKADEERR
ncbi:MAG: phosphoribosylanthranilate isomerase [Candidatus Dormibacteraeota bacterium]|nr:phosphoribosylanthranilate isomerase [Candidatus Dormibacteraeota bacterium]